MGKFSQNTTAKIDIMFVLYELIMINKIDNKLKINYFFRIVIKL